MLANSITIEILMRLFRIKMVASSRCGFWRSLAISRFFRLGLLAAVFKVAGESAKKATSDPDVNPELISNKKRSENRSMRSTSNPLAINTKVVNKWIQLKGKVISIVCSWH